MKLLSVGDGRFESIVRDDYIRPATRISKAVFSVKGIVDVGTSVNLIAEARLLPVNKQ